MEAFPWAPKRDVSTVAQSEKVAAGRRQTSGICAHSADIITAPMQVSYQDLLDTLRRALTTAGLEPDRAALCARLIADSTRDGVHSHGLNLFPRLIRMRSEERRVGKECR